MRFLPSSVHTPLTEHHLLPVAHAALLKTWFSEQHLADALEMLRSDKAVLFLWQRRYGGLLCSDGTRATLHMAEASGKRRFVFRDGTCSRCLARRGGTRCRHVAALAMLCLYPDDAMLLPLATLFPQSPWFRIGRFLRDRGAGRSARVAITGAKGRQHLVLQAGDMEATVQLADQAVHELQLLFPFLAQEHERALQSRLCKNAESLRRELEWQSASKNERILNQHGSRSTLQMVESSLGMHLARLFFLHLDAGSIATGTTDDGRYQLAWPGRDKPLLRILLPKTHTWELLDALPEAGTPDTGYAEQFSRVFFSKDGQEIVVEHCCRLADGTEYRLEDIAGNRYGTRYRVDGVVFSLRPVPEDERLRHGSGTRQLSLFSPSPAADDRCGFTVPVDGISDFLENNRGPLACGRHQVAEEIRTMRMATMPEGLVIADFEEKSDWCYLAGWYDMGSHRISLVDLLLAAEEGRGLMPGPTTLRLDKSSLAWFHGLGKKRIIGQGRNRRIRLSRGEFLALSSQIGRTEHTGTLPENSLPAFLNLENTPDPTAEKRLPGHLRPYQRLGVLWMYGLQRVGLGGILADDMGLGKTHQALALLTLVAGDDDRFLLVCPAAVLYHWPEKQERYFPGLSMTVYHGPERDLEKALAHQVVVTTYGVMRRDVELLAGVSFRMIIFDEMHALKNRRTAASSAASRLRAGSIIGLSGTPVENATEELATLLSICAPGLFAAGPAREQFRRDGNRRERQHLRRLVNPFILRRTRTQVLDDLPELSEDIRLCRLSDDQVAAYRQVIEQAGKIVEAGNEEELIDFSIVLTTIMRLKQICDHLCLLERCRDWARYQSGKWDEFTRLMEQCLASGLKVVVFSQFTTMLDIIEAWLEAEATDHVALRGAVDAEERHRRIQRFNTDAGCRVCCASLLAGGTGIDLTGAQVVIHYDRWWNPAREEQATARVHRLGQKQPVQVYKLVTAGTLEEKIHRLIEKKQRLAEDLVAEDDSSILKSLTPAQLADLFRFSD